GGGGCDPQSGREPIARAARSSGQVVPDDPKIVTGNVRELWAAGAVPHGPDVGRSGLQPFVDANISASVQLDPGLLEADSLGVWNATRRDQNVAALDLLLAGWRPHRNADFLSRASVNVEGLGRYQTLDAFVTEDPLHLIRDVGILPAHQLRPGLDDRRAAAETKVSLRQFEADIAAPKHDQMRRQVIEFESLDVGERPGSLKTGNGWNCRMRSDAEENPIAGQHARPAVIETRLQRSRRHKAPGPHDQLGAGHLVVLQMQVDPPVDHPALSLADRLADRRTVGREGAGYHAEVRALARQMRDPRAPNLVLAGQAGDVGAGAADPPALDDGSPPPRLRHVPSQQLAALSAAKDQHVKLFRSRHDLPPLALTL